MTSVTLNVPEGWMRLDEVSVGDEARIGVVGGDGSFRRRLLELGLVEGTVIVRTGQAPLGDPLSFRVRGAVICLRRTEAAIVRVEPVQASAGRLAHVA